MHNKLSQVDKKFLRTSCAEKRCILFYLFLLFIANDATIYLSSIISQSGTSDSSTASYTIRENCATALCS